MPRGPGTASRLARLPKILHPSPLSRRGGTLVFKLILQPKQPFTVCSDPCCFKDGVYLHSPGWS